MLQKWTIFSNNQIMPVPKNKNTIFILFDFRVRDKCYQVPWYPRSSNQ